MTFKHHGKEYRGQLSAAQYGNGNLAVQLMSWDEEYEFWEPYAKLSVNTELILEADFFVAKTYSENEGLIEQFIESGIFENTGQVVPLGYASGAILKLTDKFLEEIAKATM